MDIALSAWLGFGWWSIGTAIHWTSAVLARRPKKPGVPAADPTPRSLSDFSVVAPMSGAADASAVYVTALQRLADEGAEILICVADEADEAVAATRAVWPAAPILTGSDTTFNPKMNNVRKGLEAARRPVVALCDAGIVLAAPDLQRAAASLSADIGLVLVLKAGQSADNFAAELECAYINGHQARFLLAADRLGLAVASGGITVMSHDTLQRIGSWRGFNRWIADDYSVTRSVRELGLQTRLGDVLVRLPLGRRNLSTVWRRQVRWARTRLRLPVWPLVLWEPLIGWLVCGLAGAAALVAADVDALWIGPCVVGHTIAWLAGEKWFMHGYGLAFGPRAWSAAMIRECLSPVLMVQALAGRTIEWRGTDLGGQWRTRGWDAEEPRMSEGMSNREMKVIVLPEQVDSTSSVTLEATILDDLSPGARMIVDGSAVRYMSAAGVRMLATVLHRADETGACIVLCSFTGAAAECLLVSGFSQLFEIAVSVEAARDRLKTKQAHPASQTLHLPRAAG